MSDGEGAAPTIARPAGLDAIHAVCRAVYPDQPNPLQVTALVKYWLGGPDPLDYITMFDNRGDPAAGIPSHWHYVGLGLSDLHGDGRMHTVSGPGQPSGFGFELTFRLTREKGEKSPPIWPAELMQSLSRYVFQSSNVLCVGDHVSWHSPLDRQDSSIQHMLLTQDPQLSRVDTPLGYINFIQIVGIMSEELDAAQKWNGPGVLELLRKHSLTGGQWLVTNLRRVESVFDIDISNQVCVAEGVERDGSSLSGVSAVCVWEDPQGQTGTALPPLEGAEVVLTQVELLRTEVLEQVHIQLNHEAAKLLPLVIRGRLRHGRHFTYKSFSGEQAVTFVCRGVLGVFADAANLLACQGPWLQVFIPDIFMAVFLKDLEDILGQRKPLPRKLEWPDQRLAISILPNQ